MTGLTTHIFSPSVSEGYQRYSEMGSTHACNRCGYDFVDGMTVVSIPHIKRENQRDTVVWYDLYHPKCVMSTLLNII